MCDVELEPVGETYPLLVSKGQAVEETPVPVDRRKTIVSPLTLALAAVVAVVLFITLFAGSSSKEKAGSSHVLLVNIAFLGNSMFYFNDFPRFFQTFSGDRFEQNSCLHGGASIPSLYMEGNAMYPQFKTPKAALTKLKNGHMIYDFGACTVAQLLTGTDRRLDDPGYAVSINLNESEHKNYNPCREDKEYLKYSKAAFASPPDWNFVLINDNTQNPARYETRMRSLQFLERFYLPMLQETGGIPVFLWTHAYSVDAMDVGHNMTGLEDVANFTSLTYAGYKAYVDLLSPHLPESQQPRIVPVGMAFLTVYEERPALWRTLFHCDHIHASPSGSFLQACVMYYTLFGEMPPKDFVVRDNMQPLWRNSRMMQHAWEPPNPFPSRKAAAYLYDVAERVMHGHVPASFIYYDNGDG